MQHFHPSDLQKSDRSVSQKMVTLTCFGTTELKHLFDDITFNKKLLHKIDQLQEIMVKCFFLKCSIAVSFERATM